MEPSVMDSRFAQLIKAAAAVAGQAGLGDVLRTTVHTATELTGARYGALGVLGEHGTLVDFFHVGVSAETVDAIGRLPEGRGVLGTITRTGKTVRIDDISQHPDSVGFPDHHPHMAEFLGVPVRVGESIFGNLYLADKHGGFTEEDAALVESLAIIAGSAVATARLHERLGRLALVEERERIARELHDAVIGDLFGVGLSLQASAGEVSADPEGVRDRLAEAVDRLDEAIATLRRYIFDVGRPLAGRRDLEGRLRELIEDLVGPWEVDVAVSVTGVTTDAPDDLASDLLQFVREGVANALRHSGAHHIDIHLRRDGERFIIEVKDDGSGFDPDSVTRGMGLENLRRRARHAGGDTELRSSPGQGTTVKGVFPFTGS